MSSARSLRFGIIACCPFIERLTCHCISINYLIQKNKLRLFSTSGLVDILWSFVIISTLNLIPTLGLSKLFSPTTVLFRPSQDYPHPHDHTWETALFTLHLQFLSISTAFSFAQQKVLASRKELLEYDCRECKGPESSSSSSLLLTSGSKGLPGECYGCASAAIEHCVTLLRALAMVPGTRKQLVEEVRLVVFGITVSERSNK